MSQEDKRQELIEALSEFTARDKGALFNATATLLDKLGIQFDRDSAQPIQVADLYDGPMPQYLIDALDSIMETFFIGIVNDKSLLGGKTDENLEAITKMMQRGDKYDGMFIFACDAKHDANLTRTAAAALTRAFNHIACANPVILLIRQDDLISLSTCERMEYSQQWRQATGQKVGKVCILRNIKCSKTHPGHLDILVSLGDKRYPTFEELYKHWMEVFSSELLTKKFYSELSDWYAWAVQVARFPNDLNTREDDDKFNHEACIRLITRLIFVWFLKQKKLIPEEFFDEKYIRENLIDNFNPHDRENLLYNPEKSRYYRLVLQNLFFAMLNCPIVAEGKDVANNRRFRATVTGNRLNRDYNVNNLMRYESEFMEGGADKFVALANRSVPFLNGGLFDCLDDKPQGLYYDGFSELPKSLEQLSLPDYLFFGEEVGKGIDLSQWYDDRNKRNVSARGIIDILKRYSFTVEENTPLDQEVSLDPELLGKAFENLLAAYNPETKTSARKQTGSFYTPREIVQYMVDESLVAHLKRACGDELEPEYRRLLSYATDETNLDEQQRKTVMAALYNCRVLDPACGSGAFPMGALQQMVHVLRQLDPTNEMWREFMIDLAIERSKTAFNTVDEEERRERLADIEEAFNRNINDPDYARKLYLIEHCIYGVDIQPIAVQISKLRFFISLVVDQKPTDDAAHNFGIRPLPNLESKFVAANTLIPVEYDGTLVENNPDVRKYKERLRDLNHKIFLAKRNVDKQRLKESIKTTRQALANAIEDTGFVGHSEAEQLAGWDMFDQNASSTYFDPEWMFGVKDGFDIVIGNPPYVDIKGMPRNDVKRYFKLYKTCENRINLYAIFLEKGVCCLSSQGILCYINPNSMLINESYRKLRNLLIDDVALIIKLPDSVFVSADVETIILMVSRNNTNEHVYGNYFKNNDIIDFSKLDYKTFKRKLWKEDPDKRFSIFFSEQEYELLFKIQNNSSPLSEYVETSLGITPYDKAKGHSPELIKQRRFHSTFKENDTYVPLISGKNIHPYHITNEIDEYISYGPWLGAPRERRFFTEPRIVVRQIVGGNSLRIIASYVDDRPTFFTQIGFSLLSKKHSKDELKYILALLNSKLISFYHKNKFLDIEKVVFQKVLIANAKQLPIKFGTNKEVNDIISMSNNIIQSKNIDLSADTTFLEDKIDELVYHIYNLTYDEVLIIDPDTSITHEEYDNYKAD